MKHIFFVALLLFIAGCTKHTTPNKVEKRLTKGVWKVAEASSNGQNITPQFANTKFNFFESGEMSATGTITASGTWELGTDKNPVLMIIDFPTSGSLTFMSDDWLIQEISKTECFMMRNDPSLSSDKLRFRRID